MAGGWEETSCHVQVLPFIHDMGRVIYLGESDMSAVQTMTLAGISSDRAHE